MKDGGVLVELYKELKPEFEGQDPPKVPEAPYYQLLSKEDFEEFTRGHDDEKEPEKGFFVVAGIKWYVLKGSGDDAEEGEAEDTSKDAPNTKTGASTKGGKSKKEANDKSKASDEDKAAAAAINTPLDTMAREDEQMKKEAAAADAQAPDTAPGK